MEIQSSEGYIVEDVTVCLCMGARVPERVCNCVTDRTCDGLCGGDCTCIRACVFECYDHMRDECANVHECAGAHACVERTGLHECMRGM